MVLRLTNSVDKKKYEYEVTDIADSSMYWHFDITLTGDEAEGEYKYELLDKDNNVLATGIAQIGDYVNETTTAYTNNNQSGFIQYDSTYYNFKNNN